MEIPLGPDVSEKLIEYLAPIVAEFSRQAVQQIIGDITSQVRSLQNPVIEQIAETTEVA